MAKKLTSVQAAQEPAAPTPLEVAQRAIAGKTQDELLALDGAGHFAKLGIDPADLWRAYMLRIAARQDRKSTRAESAA